ncbi:RNA-binding S4 domain-containing protein [Metamycoplasma alkalescens]|uniref:Ribosome-associated protein YbcJ (S4-like RNA binding protein) n=2 Tax=Metamycoplasma alkalescens TaxID=45363 RepID=A0A318U800_9BACT|nr:RNA-binding S4 domain-containing protein [Metamycoplasma alkalescens]PYF42654.1 ribosome-associated protein YbcJ (S4-like RNA binding protein) [Metamycoplasma alkalescens]
MKIEIYGKEIKLSQFLKKIGACRTGGLTKYFLDVHIVKINDRIPNGRNAKIHVGDIVWIDDQIYVIKQAIEQNQ